MIPGRSKGKDKKTEKEQKEKEKKQQRDEEKRREKEQQDKKASHHVPSNTTEPTSTHKSHQVARPVDTTYIRSFRKGYVEMRYRNSWKYIYVVLIGGSFYMYHNSTVCLTLIVFVW